MARSLIREKGATDCSWQRQRKTVARRKSSLDGDF